MANFMSSKSTPDPEKEKDSFVCPTASMCSTPLEPDGKQHVSDLFKKMGSKLGWFEYKDLDSALNSLSNSSKKKRSSKPRRKKKDSTEDQEVDHDSSHTKRVGSVTRKKNTKVNTKSQLLFNSESPLQEITDSQNCSEFVPQSDSLDDFKIPIRRTPASTNLTKKTRTKSLSVKSNKGKENVENDSKTVKSLSHNSSCSEISSQHEQDFQKYRNQSCSSTSPESDNFDIGVPIQESTRIYSRASIDTILDITNISTGSGKELNLSGNPADVSQNTSYKQLNIQKVGKKRVSIGNFKRIEYKLQNLDLTNSGNARSMENCPNFNATNLYTTALDNSDAIEIMKCPEDSNLKSANMSRKSNTFYFDGKSGHSSSESSNSIGELHSPDQKFPNVKNLFQKPKSTTTNCSVENLSDNSSTYEVEDISIQTDKNIQDGKSKNSSDNADSYNSEFSYIEVEDACLQTCLLSDGNTSSKKEEENFSKGGNSISSSSNHSSYVDVQDTSTQTEVQKNTGATGDNLSSLQSASTSHSNNKTIFFDAESEIGEMNLNAEKLKLDDIETKNNQVIFPPRKNSTTEDQKQLPGNSISISFSSDEDENKKERYKIPDGFDSSSDDSEPFAFKTPKSVMKIGKIKTLVTDNYNTTNSSYENVPHGNGKVEDNGFKGDNHLQRKLNERDGNTKGDNQQKRSVLEEIVSSDYEEESFKDAVENDSKLNWRNCKEKFDSDTSGDDDQLENFFQKMKTTKKVSRQEEVDDDEDGFIAEDEEEEESSGDDEAFYITTTHLIDSSENKRQEFPVDFSSSESDSETEDEELPVIQKPKPRETPRKVYAKDNEDPKKPNKNYLSDYSAARNSSNDHAPKQIPERVKKYSFLRSLSQTLSRDLCDPTALRYLNNFSKSKEDLTTMLFKLYNETVFDCKLPVDLPIIWNKRLLKTAGYCVYKKETKDGNVKMSVRIELSTKVCDSAERTRDTLIHELCHAAVWLINGTNGGHGPYWKYWAKKANMVYPELPIVKRCHSYSIETKYIYECSKCKYRIGRHSKSLDTKRKVCGHCRGEFILLNRSGKPLQSTSENGCDTPRTPNKFAMFVKENYKTVKSQDTAMKHGEVMKVLSKEFAKQKLS